MGFALGRWRGGMIVVARSDGGRRLWLDEEGELCDALGRLTLYGVDERADHCELASYVAEYLRAVAENEAPTAYDDIHPELRAIVYELTPSAIRR